MKKTFMLLVLATFFLTGIGCGIKEDKASAESVATNVFEKIKAGDYNGALIFYSPQFFQQTSTDDWRLILKNVQKKLGPLQSYKLATWNFRKQATTSGSGTYWMLQYTVTYAKYPSTEALTLFKPVGGEYKILAHNINSVGLLKE